MSALQAREVWVRALGSLQVQLSRSTYDTWLRGSIGLAYQGETFSIGVPSPFAAEWLERRMLPLLQRTLTEVLKQPVTLSIQVLGPETPPPPDASAAATPIRPMPAPPSNLSSRYTFNSFAVGESNHLAYYAALAVAQTPGGAYNPLFIHADVGLGKTHLLQAIGHVAAANGRSALLTTSEEYVTTFVSSLREHTEAAFRSRYRSPDVLLMDDVQFFSGKAQSAESFFHLFDSLHRAGRQIVVTSDRPPQELLALQRPLTSRFQWGLQVDIKLPTSETRFAILQRKAGAHAIQLGDDTLRYIASLHVSSVRALEGYLTKVIAYLTVTGASPSLTAAQAALFTDLPRPTPQEAAARAIALTADFFGLSPKQLASPSREASINHARQVATYLLSRHLALPPKAISSYIGNRHPKTIQHGIQKVEREMETNPQLQSEVSSLRLLLGLP